MRRKNAFTLVELLATIAILGIISVIATPIILGIIEDTKKDTFYKSIEILMRTLDMDIGGKPYEKTYSYNIIDGEISNLEIPVSNTEGLTGIVTYDDESNKEYAIYNEKWCIKKTYDMKKAEITEYSGSCNLSTTEACFAFSKGTITDYYEYQNNDSSKKKCPKEVRIPETIGGVTVTAIGINAFKEKGIIKVSFPSTITSIGNYAFQNNQLSGELDLSHLTGLTNIGYYSFQGSADGSTNQISSIKLPSSVTSIGQYAFSNNKLIGELDLSHLTSLTSIGNQAFQASKDGNTNQLTNIKLPSSVTSIGGYAFQYNKLSGELDLSHLTSLTSIGNGAFGGTTDGSTNQLTSITLPSSVTSIESYAFQYNKLSGELDLSHLASLTSIGNGAFGGTTDGSTNQLTNVKFPSSVTTISASSFQNNKLSGELDLSYLTNLTTIGPWAFQGTANGSTNQITTVNFPSSVTSIGANAFQHNKLSGELDLSYLSKLTTIENAAFGGNINTNQIESIKFPSSVTQIGNDAFGNNQLSGELDLSHLTSLTSIGNVAFGGIADGSTNQLTNVKFPSSVTSIGNNAFANNKLSGELDLSHLTGLTTIGISAFSGTMGLKTNQITSVKFPSSVTSIGHSAFRYNKLSEELDLRDLVDVTTIDNYTFANNQLTKVIIPSNITALGNSAFAGNSLKNVVIYGKSSTSDFSFLGSGVFGSNNPEIEFIN